MVKQVYQGNQEKQKSEKSVNSQLQDIEDAFKEFFSINVLDISKEGTSKWDNAVAVYEIKID